MGAIDTGRRRLLFRRRAGTLTHHLALDDYSPARLWVSDYEGGRLLLVSSRTGRVARVLRGCPGAHHPAIVTPRRVVVACRDSGALALFGPRRRLAVIPFGRAPHGVGVAVVRP